MPVKHAFLDTSGLIALVNADAVFGVIPESLFAQLIPEIPLLTYESPLESIGSVPGVAGGAQRSSIADVVRPTLGLRDNMVNLGVVVIAYAALQEGQLLDLALGCLREGHHSAPGSAAPQLSPDGSAAT